MQAKINLGQENKSEKAIKTKKCDSRGYSYSSAKYTHTVL